MLKNIAAWQYLQLWFNNTWAVLMMNLQNQQHFLREKEQSFLMHHKFMVDSEPVCMHVIPSIISSSTSVYIHDHTYKIPAKYISVLLSMT